MGQMRLTPAPMLHPTKNGGHRIMLSNTIIPQKTLRQRLVDDATSWLIDWNFKAYLSERRFPHYSDKISQDTRAYFKRNGLPSPRWAKRDYANAHDALENAVSHLSRDYPQVLDYYVTLSERGFARLYNEVTRKAQEPLERKKDIFGYRLITHNWIAINKMRGKRQ